MSKGFWLGVLFFLISLLEDNDDDQLYTIITTQYSRLQSKSKPFFEIVFC